MVDDNTPPPAAVPGWYPQPPSGAPRWWDGEQWGPFAPPGTPVQGFEHQGTPQTMGTEARFRSWAMWSHLAPLLIWGGGLFTAGVLSIFGWVFPLVVLNTVGHESAMVRAHCVEELNFWISWAIYTVVGTLVGGVLVIATFGLALFAIIFVVLGLSIAYAIVAILASVSANSGELRRYPLTIGFLKA